MTLKSHDVALLNEAQAMEGGVKLVIGPGTGLGQGIIAKG